MPIATMTSKGQITVPRAIREALALDAGVEVEFELLPGGMARLRPRRTGVAALFGLFRHEGPSVPVSAMDPGSDDLP
jgi:antitoxin PrlF